MRGFCPAVHGRKHVGDDDNDDDNNEHDDDDGF